MLVEFELLLMLHVVPPDFAERMRQAASGDAWLNWPLSYVFAGLVVSALTLIALHIAWIASSVRRLHDMNMTGWAVLVPLLVAGIPYVSYPVTDWLPYAGYVVAALVLGFWPPSNGADRFGPDSRLSAEIGSAAKCGA